MDNQITRRETLRLSIGGALGLTSMAQAVAHGQETKAPAATPEKLRKIAEPTVKTRIFWTWDHCAEWALNRPGALTLGCGSPYWRGTAAFIEDYSRLLRWCGLHGVDAVVIWGLLRDSHGGVDAAKKLCDVAQQNGVRILCGVGLNSYGGVYYEGNSPYSLARHLQAHPELNGVASGGNACPSRKENHDFTAESLRWLFKTLPGLGGVQIESGDGGVCHCRLCQTRRQHPASGHSWEDMALLYPMAADAIRSVAPNAWIICETYNHPEPFADPAKSPAFGQGKPSWADECLARFPDNVFIQWVGDQYVKPLAQHPWTTAGRVLPIAGDRHHRHIMRAHFGTYWFGRRGELAIDWLAELVQQSVAHGFDAMSIFGEVSPYNACAELNYLALENFGGATNPRADLGVFLREVAAPLLGGEKQAQEYLRFARLVADPPRISQALQQIYAHCGAAKPPAIAHRWAWLGEYLGSYVNP